MSVPGQPKLPRETLSQKTKQLPNKTEFILAAPRRNGSLRRFPVKLLPILTGQIKARAYDWAVEGKDGTGGFREGEERKERG